jgi:hypothetical protein
MSKAKKPLFILALAAVIMIVAVSTLGSAQPVEAAPDQSYQAYENYSDDTLFTSRVFSRSQKSAIPTIQPTIRTP